MVGTLQELGVKVEAYDVAKASIPVAIITLILAYIQYYNLDRKIKKLRAK
ncbi:MAG: 5-oxoproline transporter, DUF969 family subunit [Cetobacterium sp.]